MNETNAMQTVKSRNKIHITYTYVCKCKNDSIGFLSNKSTNSLHQILYTAKLKSY